MIVIRNQRLRTCLRYVIPFLALPLLVVMGSSAFGQKHYLLLSLCAAVLSLALFIAGFERRSTGTRRLVIVAVMTALCVVGRFIPFFKPITALTIFTAMYLGGESGFLTGALAALLSNFSFGQGPWTPFQMLAWGLIGLIAGYLAEPLKRSRFFLLTYGVLAGVAYSLIMDVWSVMWYGGGFHWALYLAAIISALPYTLLYSISNFLFLYFFAKPFGEKLQRVKVKYGV